MVPMAGRPNPVRDPRRNSRARSLLAWAVIAGVAVAVYAGGYWSSRDHNQHLLVKVRDGGLLLIEVLGLLLLFIAIVVVGDLGVPAREDHGEQIRERYGQGHADATEHANSACDAFPAAWQRRTHADPDLLEFYALALLLRGDPEAALSNLGRAMTQDQFGWRFDSERVGAYILLDRSAVQGSDVYLTTLGVARMMPAAREAAPSESAAGGGPATGVERTAAEFQLASGSAPTQAVEQ
jgi:hypothetical protein